MTIYNCFVLWFLVDCLILSKTITNNIWLFFTLNKKKRVISNNNKTKLMIEMILYGIKKSTRN